MSPHANVPQRLRRLVGLAALLLAPSLVACVASPVGGPGALPAVVSMLDFTAYPKARLISQETVSENIGFIERPGRSAYRVYESKDDRRTIRAYYEKLAQVHGWSIAPLPQGLDPNDRTTYELARMNKGIYQVEVSSEDYSNTSYDEPYLPSPSPLPSDFESADPSTWPSPAPSPSPTPAGPSRIRIYVHMN
jgi:hypothetical protein